MLLKEMLVPLNHKPEKLFSEKKTYTQDTPYSVSRSAQILEVGPYVSPDGARCEVRIRMRKGASRRGFSEAQFSRSDQQTVGFDNSLK